MLKLEGIGGKYLCSLTFAFLLYLSLRSKKKESNIFHENEEIIFYSLFIICIFLFCTTIKEEDDNFIDFLESGTVFFWLGIWLFITNTNNHETRKFSKIAPFVVLAGMLQINHEIIQCNKLYANFISVILFIQLSTISYSKHPRDEMKKKGVIIGTLISLYFCSILN